ncbi:AsnC family transcriptional regulator [Marivita sp. GX14005]|uniref:Lrp/AsnC family transcriptional regulator n=1 Tax=Marivita sp. GX14005 TaxID=2942276 RepID=UPI002018F612|nr:AsnC family transcriptional regulator [Marivita sp. GX14005]MCL3882709.1 AsnC family transcriptional regulator [Marivita sp. GX14005]
MTLDETDRRILNRLQDGFPITERPFAQVAEEFGIPEDDLIARLEAMKEARVITRFGPFFDAAAMGGAFCLCAMAVPEEEFDAVAEKVNAHPEVAHNYARTHRLNMWFVLATESEAEIAQTAERIEQETGIAVLQFPKLQEFFIRFRVAA